MTPGQKLQQAFADTQVTGWLDPLRWEDFDKAGQQRYEAAARRFLEITNPVPEAEGGGELIERLKGVKPFENMFHEQMVSFPAELLAEAVAALQSAEARLSALSSEAPPVVCGGEDGSARADVAEPGSQERAAVVPAAERAGGWRPIASAPKDGTEVRVLYDDGCIEDRVYWSDERCCILGARAGAYPPGWNSTEAGHLPVGDGPCITHWQPTPPPERP